MRMFYETCHDWSGWGRVWVIENPGMPFFSGQNHCLWELKVSRVVSSQCYYTSSPCSCCAFRRLAESLSHLQKLHNPLLVYHSSLISAQHMKIPQFLCGKHLPCYESKLSLILEDFVFLQKQFDFWDQKTLLLNTIACQEVYWHRHAHLFIPVNALSLPTDS